MPYCTLKDSDTVMFKALVNLKRLILNKVVKPATTEKGTTKYIADFENSWAVQQVKNN